SLPAAASIDNSAFYRCTGLKTVSLPTAASIGEDAFYGCTSLETVSLPAATSIGEDAFLYCTGLKTVSLPAAASIGNGAFSGCTSLEKVSLPAAASIGKWAFSGAGETALTITLGAEAPWVGDSIFASISAKTVTVLVPSGATGYVPGTYSGTGTADNWGNAFRGKGWNGSGYLGSDVNSGVTLNIRYITP
ncbi:MAG: leucine-rich repeat domain-containing protein, partial [Treponema sp.]|nr:leucine-rich repeat domain-containing protein [Treponema sp.]